MGVIHLPGSAAGWARRPSGLLTINRGSPQARGLVSVIAPPFLGDNRTKLAGTLVNGAAPAVTPWGPAWFCENEANSNIDGTASYLEVPDDNAYDLTGAFTVSAWLIFKEPSAWTNSRHVLSKYLSAGNQRSWGLGIEATRQVVWNVFPEGTTTNSVELIGTATLSVETLYHIVGRLIPSAAMAVFVNGAKDNEVTSSIPAGPFVGTAPVRLGSAVNAREVRSIYGSIIDARIYNRALSDADIWQLYDPKTRWDLYAVPQRRSWVDAPAAAATGNPWNYYAQL